MPHKKTTAQLDAEIAQVLAARAAERRSPTTASGIVKKLLGNVRRLISRQRTNGQLHDSARSLIKLSEIAAEAITAAEQELAEARLPQGYEEIWAEHFADVTANAQARVADLRALRDDPAAYARTARQRFGADTAPELATALYYSSTLDDLGRALRRIESMTTRS